jgi:hypothetical protein
MTCTAAKCEKPAAGRGLCQTHYARMKRELAREGLWKPRKWIRGAATALRKQFEQVYGKEPTAGELAQFERYWPTSQAKITVYDAAALAGRGTDNWNEDYKWPRSRKATA